MTLNFLAIITDVIFSVYLLVTLLSVIKQLGLFFKNVGITNYPMKSLSFLIISMLVLVVVDSGTYLL